jgi:hypothetical protein
MREIDKEFAHGLIENDRVALLHEFSDNLALVVFDDKDLKELIPTVINEHAR